MSPSSRDASRAKPTTEQLQRAVHRLAGQLDDLVGFVVAGLAVVRSGDCIAVGGEGVAQRGQIVDLAGGCDGILTERETDVLVIAS